VVKNDFVVVSLSNSSSFLCINHDQKSIRYAREIPVHLNRILSGRLTGSFGTWWGLETVNDAMENNVFRHKTRGTEVIVSDATVNGINYYI